MTTINVSNAAQLQSALTAAKSGDTISLAAGNYGDVSINGKAFASDVLITSQTPGTAVMNTLTVINSSHLDFDNLVVKFTPTATTYSFSSAVEFRTSSDITFTHSTVTGGPAVSGIKQDGTGVDYYGNVQGLPTGYGISINASNSVKVDGVEVSQFYKGLVLANSNYVTVENSDVHDTRTTPIVVGGGSHITIDSNHLHDVNPFQFGATGDHADYLALWTSTGVGSTDIKITNNLMEQGKGQAVLGMWLQGGQGDTGFTDVTISGNAILAGNFQGIVLSEVTGGVIDHNTLLQTSGTTFDTAPSILLAVGSEKISVHDNITSAYNDTSGSKGALANTASNNTIVQKFDPTKAGYYTNDAIVKAEAAHDISSLLGLTTSHTSTPVVTTPVVTAPVVTAPVVTTPVVTVPVVTAPASSTDATTPTVTNMTLNGGWDWQKLVGGSGNDIFNSKTTGDTLVGGAGDDTYNLIGGSKTLVVEAAGGGTDTVISKGDYTLGDNVENLTLAPASDNWGGAGNSLNNVIKGNAGGNGLDGGAGNDTIDGGAGADYITGGTGNDLLTGGLGKDTFRFGPGSGRDTVTDFSKTDHDAIDITAYLKTSAKVILTDVGTDVQISFGGSTDVITLTGVHAKDLVSTFYGFTA